MRINPTSEVLSLHGQDLSLQSLKIDGNTISNHTIHEQGIDIPWTYGDGAIIEITVSICPEKNTHLEGLYFASRFYCTQNEPEGFRHITYTLDRPDVMSRFHVRIEADKTYPILLSNGNKIAEGELENNRHFTEWDDPFLKPTYLFALVAADLEQIHETFTTMSGRVVDLYIFVDHGKAPEALHAMESLKRSMRWDEVTFGREYDLDVFHIVATESFNMGAMENKGLNIFNSMYVLASLEKSLDVDFLNVEAVIGHEYFHNWTGNRITCRDWFQLTLKEGLTVFRDQSFSGDMHSNETQRIGDIQTLREIQFTEDAGSMTHPIQPDSYIEMNNFYTATVYEKGSEVIRMIATMLGKEKFRKAMDLYFETFDGQAVTTQDFVWAMSTGAGRDLTQFEETWYHQSHTPMIQVTQSYNI
jgi:aminopeptidase N